MLTTNGAEINSYGGTWDNILLQLARGFIESVFLIIICKYEHFKIELIAQFQDFSRTESPIKIITRLYLF